MFGKLLNGVTDVVKAIAPAAIAVTQPEVLINNAVGAVVKHATKIDNQAIPGLNVILSSAASFVKNGMATGNWSAEAIMPAVAEGAMLAAGSTATHQGTKILSKRFAGKSI